MRTLGEVIERNAHLYPDREALICGNKRLTHGHLADRVCRLAFTLYKLGMRRQDRVAILSANNLEYYESYHACEWAGFIAAAINFRLAPAEIAYLLEQSAPKVLIFEAQFTQIIRDLRPALKDIHHLICIGETDLEGAIPFESAIVAGESAGPPIRSRPEDYPNLLFSSGTTGRPKGVIRSHRRWCQINQVTALVNEFNSATRMLMTAPAFHLGGIGYVNPVAWMGGTSIIHKSFDPVAVLKTIASESITFTFMVPAMLQAVLDVPNAADYDISSIKSISTAAAPVPVPLLKRAIEKFGPVFGIQFGMTESSACWLPPHLVNPDGSEDDIKRLASVGHPVPGLELRIVDDDGIDCPKNEPGEIWLRSEYQFDAYWNNSVATLEAITEDGWFKTGDVAYQDAEGYVFIVDRKKDMIISGGENIYSREVEIAINEYTGVVDCAVVGKPDTKWGECVHAFVVLADGAQVDEEDIVEHCRQLIAKYKCPKGVTVIDKLPRNPTGKIDKVTLRKQAAGSQ